MHDLSRWIGLVKTLGARPQDSFSKMEEDTGKSKNVPIDTLVDLTGKYDLLDIVLRDLCNGFGIRDSHGACYAYGSYPLASFFNHSW